LQTYAGFLYASQESLLTVFLIHFFYLLYFKQMLVDVLN